MDFILLFQAALMGLIEGLTEFIPVSSTGHMLLLGELIGFQGPAGKTFEVAIQLGAILAICWLYRAKLWATASGLPKDRSAQRFTLVLFLGFIPSAIIGLLAHGFIKSVLFSPMVVAISLLVGGIAILLIERRTYTPKTTEIDNITPSLALKIGFCQCLAMIPGVSRSGATILGGILLGLDRKSATEFSFFLAIPTMLAATIYDLYKNLDALHGEDLLTLGVGFLAAFATALLVVKTVVGFVARHGFMPFAYYRIALGTIALVWLLLR